MTKLRDHKGGFAESMATAREVATFTDLVNDVQDALRPWGRNVHSDDVEVKPYYPDSRIGWDTHIVTVKNYGVYGFTDGPLS